MSEDPTSMTAAELLTRAERAEARVREVSANYDAQIYNLTAKRDEHLARIAELEGALERLKESYPDLHRFLAGDAPP